MIGIEWKERFTWCQALKYCALLSAMLCLSSVDMCAAAIRAARELQLRDPRPSPRRACNTSNHHHVVLVMMVSQASASQITLNLYQLQRSQ